MSNRIYEVIVEEKGSNLSRLVKAVSAGQAVRHVAGSMIRANVATQERLVALVQAKVAVEDATGEEN